MADEALQERRFSGPEDAALVISGEADAFHMVLGGIVGAGCPMGVFVHFTGLVLDYRMEHD